MAIVIACWVLAMLSGLSWGRGWTGVFTGATVVAFLWTQAATLTHGGGWLLLAVLGIAPWLLDLQRADQQRALKALHAQEAREVMTVSETTRALRALQEQTQQFETQIAEITDLYHVTKETARALHLRELFALSLDIAPRLLSAKGLRLVNGSGEAPTVLRARRTSDGRMMPQASEGEGPHTLVEMERLITEQVSASGQAAWATAQTFAGPLADGASSVAWAPLWREQKPVGVLIADDLPQPKLKTLTIVANQLSLQLSRIHLYQRVESLAVTDALTGLFVRRHFLERAADELARSQRHHLSCALLMVDLDHFKQKNDTYGHLVGDVVLKEVAGLLSRNLREVDLMARFGGEEFILLLIETTAEQAMPIAERLRQLVEVQPIRAYDEVLTQTISMGVAGFPEDAQTLEALIERADEALYGAKRAGRNRVVPYRTRRSDEALS